MRRIRSSLSRSSPPCTMPTPKTTWWFEKLEIDAGRFKSVADLRGKPCAINAKGVATEWVLDEVLQPGGLRIDNLDVKTLPFPEMLPALDNGAIHLRNRNRALCDSSRGERHRRAAT